MAEQALKIERQTQVCKCCGKELPLEMFRVSKLGRFQTCKDCVSENHKKSIAAKKFSEQAKEEADKARRMRLSDFTPRELMAELKRRGYKFTMEFVETHIINSKDIEI